MVAFLRSMSTSECTSSSFVQPCSLSSLLFRLIQIEMYNKFLFIVMFIFFLIFFDKCIKINVLHLYLNILNFIDTKIKSKNQILSSILILQFNHPYIQFLFVDILKIQLLIIWIYQQMRRILSIAILLGITILAVRSTQNSVAEPPYTENLQQFKNKQHYNARSQKLLACWLYLREQSKKEGSLINNEQNWLHVIKRCMNKITRKSAVLKITELGKRNFSPPTPFQQIVSINDEINVAPKGERTEFDKFLLTRSNQFTKQFEQILKKGNIQSQIQEQLKKRQKFYFGIIPASMVNHTTILISASLLMMCCCTWFRFYSFKMDKVKDKKKKIDGAKDQDHDQLMIKQRNKSSISKKRPSKKTK